MIVLIHTIRHVIAELSPPSWQKEVRDITYQVINAMKEAKNMSVVPRSTGNTNSGTRELTLKRKFKCYVNP